MSLLRFLVDEGIRPYLLAPDWPRREGVCAVMTLRASAPGLGQSVGPFGDAQGGPGLNLGLGSGEQRAVVQGNRQRLSDALGVLPCWLNQVHGTRVVEFTAPQPPGSALHDADGAWTRTSGVALAVLVADCMPVLFRDRSARVVAVAHAGWRGLAAGLLEATVRALPLDPSTLEAWLGPAIGPADFEVGEDVLDAFLGHDMSAAAAFVAKAPGKWYADLGRLARQRLEPLGVTVFGTPPSTVSDATRFFSFRRDRITGRMAALIWLDGARAAP